MLVLMRVVVLTIYVQQVSSFFQSCCHGRYILGLYHGEPLSFQHKLTSGLDADQMNFSVNSSAIFMNATLAKSKAEGIDDIVSLSVVIWRTESSLIELWNIGSSCDRVVVLGLLIKKGIFQYSESYCEVAVFGPSCSGIAFTIAELIWKSGATSVKYFDTSPLAMPLAAEVRDSSVPTLLPPVDRLADVGVALIRHANWSQIVALYDDDDVDLAYTFNRLQYLLRSNRTAEAEGACKKATRNTLARSAIVSANGHFHLDGILKMNPTNIVFLLLTAKQLRSFFCRQKINGQNGTLQWVILKTSFEEILLVEDGSTGCSEADIHFALQMAIAVGYNSTSGYHEDVLLRAIAAELRGQNISSSDPLFVYQFGLERKTIGMYNDSLTIYEQSEPIFYSSDFRKVDKFVSVWEFVFTVVLTIALFVSTVTTHVLILYYWNSKSIRATGPKLQQLTVMGIYILTFSLLIFVLFKGVDFGKAHPHFCMVYNIALSFSMSILVASLAMHHWRLYRIFHSYMKPGEMLSNWSLLLQSMALSLFPLLVCLVWLLVDFPDRQEAACVRSH